MLSTGKEDAGGQKKIRTGPGPLIIPLPLELEPEPNILYFSTK